MGRSSGHIYIYLRLENWNSSNNHFVEIATSSLESSLLCKTNLEFGIELSPSHLSFLVYGLPSCKLGLLASVYN